MSKTPYIYFEPDKIASLKNLGLLARRAVEGFITGLHRSPHRGFSVEFSEHREYVAGDDLRHMDWIAWGRSDRFYIKQYEQQTNLRAHILLDVSASMNYQAGAPTTKFAYGCFLAGCLAYLMSCQQDQVGLIGFDSEVRFRLAPGSTPAHMDRIFKQLEMARPSRQTAMASTLHELAQRIGKRGLIIVISDLYDEPSQVMRAFQHFVYKKHQMIVFHVMDPAELEFPFQKITALTDLETGQRLQVDPRYVRESYLQEIRAFIDGYRKECSDRNIEYVLAPTDQPYERMLTKYLSRRKALRR